MTVSRGPDDSGGDRSFDFDPAARDHPSSVVVRGVARVTSRDVLDLEPLSDVVDADALDALFDGRGRQGDFYRSSARSETTGLHLSFEYEGCAVTVRSDRVFVEEA